MNSDPNSPYVYSVGMIGQELDAEHLVQLQTDGLAAAAVVPEEAPGTGAPTVTSIPQPEPRPVPPVVILRKRPVKGRYRATNGPWQLELRVDVDGTRPMTKLSGDFYKVSGGTVSYYGSLRVDSPTVTATSTTVTVEGTETQTYTTGYPKVKVTIPRTYLFQPTAPATVQFFSPSNAPGATYICAWESAYFRTIQCEQDSEQGVTPFVSYNTGLLPSGGPARTLSVISAYAEAGIEVQVSPGADVVPSSEAGTNLKWNNSELHASMLAHFSLWKDVPQWKVWLLAAYEYEDLPGWITYGIMFDQQGKQRQGCATFHKGIGGATPEKQRHQLYTYVHEMGHCFNLMHSWQKSYAVPGVPDRPKALSWMNYDWKYPDGAAAFWSSFPFQFDDPELIHLRHAYRDQVIMGGNDFTVGAALTALQDPEAFAPPVEDNSGLQLVLEAPKSFGLGEPVVVELKLRTTDTRGKRVHAALHPNSGFVRVGIRKPNGQVSVYQPLIDQCTSPPITTLDAETPTVYDSAYIGHGKDGFYFDQTGLYRLRAVYTALDGSQVASNILNVRVRAPLSSADEEVADLFFGDEQGVLLFLLGSDSEFLKSGNDAFDEMLKKYGAHRLAVYARLLKGINAGRKFKTVTPDKKVAVRKPEPDVSSKLLGEVVDLSESGMGVDNITLNMAMRYLARVQKSGGDDAGAKATLERMVGIFRQKALKPHVMRTIEFQASTAL